VSTPAEPAVADQEEPSASASDTHASAAFATLALLCLAYAINAADRQLFSTLLPSIRAAFGWDLKASGLLSTAFTLGLAAVGIPAGYLVDRASRKAMILVAMVIYSAFTVATIFAVGFWDMLVYRVLTGVGEGVQMAALFAAVGGYFHRKRSLFIGWLILAYGVGAFVGPRAGARLHLAAGSWRAPFAWFSFAGLVIAALVLLFVPSRYTESKGPQSNTPVGRAALEHMPRTLWNHNVILGFIGCVVLGFSLYGFMSLYAVFAKEELAFSGTETAAAFSFFGLGGLLSFLGGWCGDHFPQRRVIATAFACLAAVGYSIYNVVSSVSAQSLLTFLIGVFGSGFVFVNLLSLLQRSVRPEMVGRASGIFLTSLFGAASIAGYLFGTLVDALGWGAAALIELTLFPISGVIAMGMVNPKQLIAVMAKNQGG
jgi:MFS family permease